METNPTSRPPRLVAMTGGREAEPPQPRPQWRFTPDGRCKESLWRALLSGVFYGAVSHSLFQAVVPSEEDKFDINFEVGSTIERNLQITPRTDGGAIQKRLQLGLKHMMEPLGVLMGIGFVEYLRLSHLHRPVSASFLNPKQTMKDLFNNCMDREVVSGKELIANARRKSPLRLVQFQAIPWPTISAHDVVVIARRQEERQQMIEAGAALAAGGAVAQEVEGLSFSALLVGAATTVLAPFFVAPPSLKDDPSTRLL